MVTRLDFGFPEVALLCGVWLLHGGHFGIGISLCVLATLSAFARSIITVQQQQQEAEERKSFYKELNVSGIGLTNAFSKSRIGSIEDDVFH